MTITISGVTKYHNMKKAITLAAIGLFLLTGSALTWKVIQSASQPTSTSYKLIYNPNDDREVVGAHENVFVGKVTTDLGSTPFDAIVQRQFNVEAIYNVKGDLDGQVIVSQIGSYADGNFFAFSESGNATPTLQVGSTYIFATRRNSEKNWHVLSSHGSGIKLLSSNTGLTRDQIIALSETDERVNQLKEAFKNQIIPEILR